MKMQTKEYPIWYAEIEIDNQQAYNLVVDALCDFTGRQYSFRFEIESTTFLEAIEDGIVEGYINTRARSDSSKANAKRIVEQAKFYVTERGSDILIFSSVKEVTSVREIWDKHQKCTNGMLSE